MVIVLVLGIIIMIGVGIYYWRQQKLHWVIGILGLVLIVLGSWGYYVARQTHFGLTRVSVEKTEKINPATNVLGYKLLLTEKTGNDQYRYTYQYKGKSYQTLSEGVKTNVKRVDKKTARLTTRIVTYQAKTIFSQIMLVGLPTFVQEKTEYHIQVPKNWYVISKAQLNQLSNMQKKAQNTITDKVPDEVKSELEAAAGDDPDVLTNQDKQKDIQNKALEKVTADVNKQLKVDIKKKLAVFDK